MSDTGTITEWIDLVRQLGLGLTVAALVIIWSLYKGHLVWGWYCKAIEKERDEWKHAALSGTGILEKLVERIEQRRV